MGRKIAKHLGSSVLLVLGAQPGLAIDSCPTNMFDLRGEWYSPIPENDRPGNKTLFQLTLPSIETGSVGCYWDDHIAGGYGHFRVDHSKDEFARGRVHINGIEGFWGMGKVRLAKFKGLPRHTFHLHLKETEWRYNTPS